MGGQWIISNSKGPGFELTTSMNTSTGNPFQNPDEVQSAVFRYHSDKTAMFMANANLMHGIILQAQMMYNDPECKDVIQMINLQKDFRDCSFVFRFQGMQGQGIYTGTFMQSLNKNIQCGFQLNAIVSSLCSSFASADGARVQLRVLRLLLDRRKDEPPVLRLLLAHAAEGVLKSQLCRQAKSEAPTFR
jgi:hypothetical protein